MKNKNKEQSQVKRNFLIGLVICGLIIIGFIGGLFVASLNFSDEKTLKESLSDVDKIIEYNKNLSYTQQVFTNCSTRENESERLLCVNKWAIDNYNYIERDEAYSIDEMFEKGADCVSYSIYYATLAEIMGYEYLFVIMPNHVMTIVYFENGYCTLDGKFGECIYYEED